MPQHERTSYAEQAAAAYLDQHRLWHWAWRCAVCEHLGQKPGAPEAFGRPPLSYLPVLSLDAAGHCQHCARAATDGG